MYINAISKTREGQIRNVDLGQTQKFRENILSAKRGENNED